MRDGNREISRVENQAGESVGVAVAAPTRVTADGNTDRMGIFGIYKRLCDRGCKSAYGTVIGVENANIADITEITKELR